MQEAIEECYERLGRYLFPDITVSPIIRTTGDTCVPREGQCSRTGVRGSVVIWDKSDGTVVPTHTKLLWMLGYQNRVGRSSYRISFGEVAFLPKTILSTVAWADKKGALIPGMRVVETRRELIQQALGQDRYLLFGFGKNADKNFGNGLRYSSGNIIELNGVMSISNIDFENQSIDFHIPLEISRMKLDWKVVFPYCRLRKKESLTETEHARMMELKQKLGPNANRMMVLARQVIDEDLRIGRWLED